MTSAARLAVALTTGAAVVALLGGCTFGAPTPDRSTTASVRVDRPSVPAALRLPGEQVTTTRAVGPSGSRPAIVAFSRQKSGRPPSAEIWNSTDGQTWTRASGFSPPTGIALTGIRLAAVGRMAAVTASGWSKGVARPILWSSSDGSSWRRVGLPKTFGVGTRVAAVAVLGERIAVVGTEADGGAIGAVLSGGAWRASTMPDAGRGRILNPAGLAGRGDRAVLIARPAADGARGDIRSYTSADGVRWTAAGSIAARAANVYGVVATPKTLVVTGSQPDEGSVARPVAWSSTDGGSWTSERLGEPAEPGMQWDELADVQLDAPSVGVDGSVSAVMADQNSGYSTVWTRTPDGAWSEVGRTGGNSSNGEGGFAFAMGGGRVAAVLGGDGWSRAGVFGPAWSEGTAFARRDLEFVPGSASVFGGGIVVPSTRPEFQLETDGGWTNTERSRIASVSAKGALSVVTGVPEQAAQLSGPVYGATGKGGVVLGSTWDGVGPILATGFASADGGAWTAVTGFPTDGATDPAAVERIDKIWIAVADRRASTAAASPAHASVFTSSDGITWSAAAGDFGSGSLTSAAQDVCAAPDGRPVAVGWVERAAGGYSPAAWSPDGGVWKRLALGKLGATDGYLESCAGDGTSLTVSGILGGRSALLSVSKTGSWSTGFTAPRGESVGRPVRVPGGFAASGNGDDGGTAQPVVWLSRTGRTWTPVAVPALQPGSTTAVAPLGEDLVVAMPPSLGGPVVIVRDVRTVIERSAR